jgi:catechol 2,3-dioxygenase-like lactoylglutathione lyase family enzyme
MDFKLEVVPIPVTDIDRAKAFYADRLGFAVDLDVPMGEGGRLVQLTPPGSGCSIHLNSTLRKTASGSLEGLMLIVDDIEAARAELVGRGAEVGPVQHMVEGEWVEGKGGDWNSFVFFSDPDGNEWVLQERPAGT